MFVQTERIRFTEVERELEEVAHAQGFDVDELLELIRLNEETMDLMRVSTRLSVWSICTMSLVSPSVSKHDSCICPQENLRQKVIQDIIGIIMRSGKGNKQGIDRVEAKLLALKITVKLEAYGITFDEDKFLNAVALNPTLMGLAGTVRKLLPPDEGDGDDGCSLTITSFVSGKDDVYDMFYMRGELERIGGSVSSASQRGRVSLSRRRHTFYAR